MSDLQQKFNALLKVNEQLLEANKELAAALEQQAAVIEQMREALAKIAVSVCYTEDRTFGQRMGDINEITKEALALQPCPEVLNKVRADAVRKAANDMQDQLVISWDARRKLANYADRIEKGEV